MVCFLSKKHKKQLPPFFQLQLIIILDDLLQGEHLVGELFIFADNLFTKLSGIP